MGETEFGLGCNSTSTMIRNNSKQWFLHTETRITLLIVAVCLQKKKTHHFRASNPFVILKGVLTIWTLVTSRTVQWTPTVMASAPFLDCPSDDQHYYSGTHFA